MVEFIKKWWEKYQDGAKVRKKETNYLAVGYLFIWGEWKHSDANAVSVYTKAHNEYRDAYNQYYLKWGEWPRVERERLAFKLRN
jgi:uncharacterized membrane-anchored protein